jgi:hypothetical protein
MNASSAYEDTIELASHGPHGVFRALLGFWPDTRQRRIGIGREEFLPDICGLVKPNVG